MSTKPVFTKPFTQQEPIPPAAIARAVEVMQSGRLHRYNLAEGDTNEASQLEREYAEWQGVDYCVACTSGGYAIQLALRACGVEPGDKVLTNAHVVELAREERNLVIGVIPSEGSKTYGGRIIAYSPGNDLALIQLEEGSLPVSTFYAGAVNDGQHVTAIGYPGTVDRAQGLGLKQLVEPLATVKTSGNISSGRASQSFDTILHTAPLAAGNSGGPLVDDCGRVLGVNSFGSISDGNDAEFGFAVSWREIASFLRQAGVSSLRTVVPCDAGKYHCTSCCPLCCACATCSR